MTSEPFLVRLVGGPYEGDRTCFDGDDYFGVDWRWPFVASFAIPEKYGGPGRYVKSSESQLSAQPPRSGVLRGALYEWETP